MNGGNLELNKCALYVITWDFNEDGTPISFPYITCFYISYHPQGKKTVINVFTNDTPFEYLGIT